MDRFYKLYSSLPAPFEPRKYAEIDLNALRHNYRLLHKTVTSAAPPTRLIAVVKADAYGHGAPACVGALLDEGCDFFAVSCIEEAVAVRAACNERKKAADVLILGYTEPADAPLLAQFDIIQSLLSESHAAQLEACAAAAGVCVRCHVILDTGMNRIGFSVHSDEELLACTQSVLQVGTYAHLAIEGMFTHLARADEDPNGEGDARTDEQLRRYRKVVLALEKSGMHIPFHHTCNSAATLRRPSDHMNGVRVGILLYGARPSDKVDISLRPVMKLRTKVTHLHKLLPGEELGYGGTYTAQSERLIATLPIGYGDGLLRAYSGAEVTVHTSKGDQKARIVGRICMDQCMLDVTDTDAALGDTVTLFGNTPNELHALARRAQTIDYECLCLISGRVVRINTKDAIVKAFLQEGSDTSENL